MVMPLGLDLDRYVNCEEVRGQFRRELGLDQDVLLVGIVARLVPIKAHELFLEAAAIVAGRFPQIRFIVVGDGERREDLESLVRQLGCEGQVLFLGWRQDLDRIYADLDLAVLTSRNEGSPVSLIEAMAAGLAVVSTRVGGVPDLVQDGMSGMLVESEDIGGLAEAIVSLLGDPQRRKALGEVGRRRVYPAYSADRLLGDMDHLYSELLSQRGL